MESPQFGGHTKNHLPVGSAPYADSKYVLALFSVENDFNKLFHTISLFLLKSKAVCFCKLKSAENDAALQYVRVVKTYEIKTQLHKIASIIKEKTENYLCRAFARIQLQSNSLKIQEQKDLSIVEASKVTKKRKNTKNGSSCLPDDWKENSTQNCSQILMENEKLEQELWQLEQEKVDFMEEMEELLENHEKGRKYKKSKK